MDFVRIRGGKATGVNRRDGVETSDVSGRAAGFMAMLAPFQEKVCAYGFAYKFYCLSHSSYPTWTFQSVYTLNPAFSCPGKNVTIHRIFTPVH
jgi:hypothetical protein